MAHQNREAIQPLKRLGQQAVLHQVACPDSKMWRTWSTASQKWLWQNALQTKASQVWTRQAKLHELLCELPERKHQDFCLVACYKPNPTDTCKSQVVSKNMRKGLHADCEGM